MNGVAMERVEVIAAAALALPEAQRVALANRLIGGVTDGACALQLSCLERHAGQILREMARAALLREGK